MVGHDCRNNSRLFAETVAAIFSANGIKAYLFESLRPTPEISFAIRELGAKAGVNVTASHNPKEYNGREVRLQGLLERRCSGFGSTRYGYHRGGKQGYYRPGEVRG